MGNMPRVFSFTGKRALISLALILAVAGWVGYGLWVQYKHTAGQAMRLEVALGGSNELLGDSDSDGLKNWEEALWDTNSNNPDTDGDGVLDGEEAKNSQDPKEPGPGKGPEREKPAAISSALGGSATETFAKSLIEKGILGASASENPAERFTEAELTQLAAAYPKSRRQYVADEIGKIAVTYDQTNRADITKAYLNGVAEAYFKAYEHVKKGDLESVAEGIGNNFDMSPLDPYVAATENLKTRFLALNPPIGLKAFHGEGMRVIFEALFDLHVIQNAKNDPLAALIAIQNREITKIEISKLYDDELGVWIRQSGIKFGAEEIGYVIFGW